MPVQRSLLLSLLTLAQLLSRMLVLLDLQLTLAIKLFTVGVDCIETNTFGANFANLAEYGIEDRIEELAEAAELDAAASESVGSGYLAADASAPVASYGVADEPLSGYGRF